MPIIISYGLIAVFLIFIIFVLERLHRKTVKKTAGENVDFTEYAVAGRSFGAWYQTMAFLNTWLPGTMFIAFAGMAAQYGVIGYYSILYALLAVLFMFFMAQRVFNWGKAFDLRTQADFVGMRYNAKSVRLVAAIIGIVSSFPWLILAFQSLGLVFSYLSFGLVNQTEAVFIGVAIMTVRQIWTVRMGMRGIMVSDMIQGVVAYGVGSLIAVGLIFHLISSGHGFAQVDPTLFKLPGLNSDLGALYFFSIVFTGAMGSWCWPDIFVRLFTGNSVATIRKSAIQSAPLLFIFSFCLFTMALLASSMTGVIEKPDHVWFVVASECGVLVLSLAGLAVLSAVMGNLGAVLSSIGALLTQDIMYLNASEDKKVNYTHMAKILTSCVAVLAVIGALLMINTTTGLIQLALISYQGIVQLAPALYIGLFWRKGNATGAIFGMLVGCAVAAMLQIAYPLSISPLWGLTSGVVGLMANLLVYVAFSYIKPVSELEKQRIDYLFDSVGSGKEA